MKRLYKFLAVAVVAVLLALALFAVFYEPTVPGFRKEDLVEPLTPIVEWPAGTPPSPSTSIRQTYAYSIEWLMTEVYEFYGGVLRLSLNNTGIHSIFVYGFGLRYQGSDSTFERQSAILIEPGNEAELGLLAFAGPWPEGSYNYQIRMDLAVATLDGSHWFDCGEVASVSQTMNVKNFTEGRSYAVKENPRDLYNQVNGLVNKTVVQPIADAIRANNSGNFSIWQVLDAYEWVRTNVNYTKDVGGDHWQSPNETLQLRTGDCEDFALLMDSIIWQLGGNARFNLIDGHAFATVFVTADPLHTNAVRESVESYYHVSTSTLRISYLHDDFGYWMVVDPAGFMYGGGMPSLSQPPHHPYNTDARSIESSTWLKTADVTGAQASWHLF